MTHAFIQRCAIALLPVLSCMFAPYSYYDPCEPRYCPAGFCHYQHCPYCCCSYIEDTFDPPRDTTGARGQFRATQSSEARKK